MSGTIKLVHEGDLLFVVDPRPYEIAVARARASLALTRKEVEGLRNGVSTAEAGVARASAQLDASAADIVRRETDPVAADAEIARLQAQRVASEAALYRAEAELRYAEDYLARLEQLLPEVRDRGQGRRGRARSGSRQPWRPSRRGPRCWPSTPRSTKLARRSEPPWPTLTATRAQHVATEAALRQSRATEPRAEDAIGQLANTNARIAAAEARGALGRARSRVHPRPGAVRPDASSISTSRRAPSRGRGVEVFTLVDTGTWYVMANFRETQLRHIPQARRSICICNRSPDGASGARSSGSAGPFCPRTEPA